MTEETGVAPEQEATEEGVTEEATQEEDQQAEGSQDGEEGEQPDDQDGDDKPKSRHQRRKEQMERYRQEADEANRKYEAVQERLKRIEELTGASTPPKESDFASYEEYQAALSAHHAMRMMDGRTKQEAEREAQAYQQEMQRVEQARQHEVAQGWAAQVSDAKTRYADFEQVAYTAPISDQVSQMIAGMDAGADVAYQLGLNPAEARRISSLSPMEAAMELGRMEARLSAPQPRTATQAPDPVKPVRPKASTQKDPSKMSISEYRAWRAGKA